MERSDVLDAILDIVCEEMRVQKAAVKEDGGERKYSVARQFFWRLALKHPMAFSLNELAHFVNRKSHATVLSGVRTGQNIDSYDKLQKQVFDKMYRKMEAFVISGACEYNNTVQL